MQTEIKRNINAGHRGRMREKLYRSGSDSFLTHELLEMLLYYVMPRCDTNPIAHRLLEAFGSLEALLAASPEELARVRGVGEKAAAFLALCRDTADYAIASIDEEGTVFKNIEELEAYGASLVRHEGDSALYLVLMDNRFALIDSVYLGHLPITSPRLSARDIAAPALQRGASMVMLVANRATSLMPTTEEKFCARSLSDRLWKVGVNMVEYEVVCGERYVGCSRLIAGGFAQRPDISDFFGHRREDSL